MKCDQTIRLKNYYAAKDYSAHFRRIKFYDKEQNRTFVFITNNLKTSAIQIAMLYKYRWQIELFFKWVKQYLRIKVFWGERSNAVKTQIWVAVCNYVLVAILKKELEISISMNEMLQILSISSFDKAPVNQLFTKVNNKDDNLDSHNQLILFDF